MKQKTCAKLRLFALVILGVELIGLCLLLLAGPLASAFAANDFIGLGKKSNGEGSTYRRTAEFHGYATSTRGRSGDAQNHFHYCMAHPYACLISYGSWSGPQSFAGNYALGPSGSHGSRGNPWFVGNGSGHIPKAFDLPPPGGQWANENTPTESNPSTDNPSSDPVGGDDAIEPTDVFNTEELPPGTDVPGPEDVADTYFTDPIIPEEPGDDLSDLEKTAPPADTPSDDEPFTPEQPTEAIAVPEPASGTLVVVGLAGMVLARFRKKPGNTKAL